MLVAFISEQHLNQNKMRFCYRHPWARTEADQLFDELIVTRRLQRIGTRSGQIREWRILLPGLPAAIGRAV